MTVDRRLSPPGAIAGIILAGGRGRRLGGISKGDLEIGGRSIARRLRDRLIPQTAALAVNLRPGSERHAALGLPRVYDDPAHGGPLAGLLAGLDWAETQGCSWLLTVPNDTPFLPADLVARLAAGIGHRPVAIGASAGRSHPVVGLWSLSVAPILRERLARGGEGRICAFAAERDAAVIEWPVIPFDPFLNVNTPEDRAEAERIGRLERNGGSPA